MSLPFLREKVFIYFRRSRMKKFYATFQPSALTRLLDIGGSPHTWVRESSYDAQFPVTLVNIRPITEIMADRFAPMKGDATNLPFADESFDIAFSNSAIEHMTTWEQQCKFANEARRMAKKLWVQTPARSFPVEAHFLALFFQYLPQSWQRRLARHFTLWGWLARPTAAEVEEMISDIRLLTYKEMKQLFPDCLILKERVFGLTKSYVAVRGLEG
jgi:hypothetical protein